MDGAAPPLSIMIRVVEPVHSTWTFLLLLAAAAALSLRRARGLRIAPADTTYELKGFAILAVVFAHLGYFASTDHRFLWPASVMAGVAVNLFLLASGYGLSVSMLDKPSAAREFYRRRLPALYIPLWIVLFVLFIADAVVLHRFYSWGYIGVSFAGVFASADVARDVDSPLWYFTLTLFYYVLFPVVFNHRRLWLSALILFTAASLPAWGLPWSVAPALALYRVHAAAFPLGVLAAWTMCRGPHAARRLERLLTARHPGVSPALWLRLLSPALWLLIAVLAIRSGVGGGWAAEQSVSILTALAIAGVFVLKRTDVRLLRLFGTYSYGIYLVHWPLVARYDLFYAHLPAWLATVAYVTVCLVLGYLLWHAARPAAAAREPGPAFRPAQAHDGAAAGRPAA
jgi:peptidoglycan/LPS O-acetylase OafA/YrhL